MKDEEIKAKVGKVPEYQTYYVMAYREYGNWYFGLPNTSMEQVIMEKQQYYDRVGIEFRVISFELPVL